MEAKICRILDRQRELAQRYDWSQSKPILAAIVEAEDAIDALLRADTEAPTASELASAVLARRDRLRELWTDDIGQGSATLGEIARELAALDDP